MHIRLPRYAAALGVSVFISLDASAQIRQQLTDTSACGIQVALLESPGHYVIAIVEHPGKLDCNDRSCTESLKIVKCSHRARPPADGTPTPL